MKIIKYKFFYAEINHGTEDKPDIEQIFLEKSMTYSEANEAIAKREAHNGVYEIFDDGQPDPSDIPTQLDIIEAQVTYTALMTDTLLVAEDTEVEEDSTDGSNSTGETEIESDSPVEDVTDNVETPIEETYKEQLDEVEDTPVIEGSEDDQSQTELSDGETIVTDDPEVVEDTPIEPENQEAFVEETTLVEEVETDVSEN